MPPLFDFNKKICYNYYRKIKEEKFMAKLNEKNQNTEKIIHLMITTLCNRNCKYCCNKQYDINLIPFVTNEELLKAEILFLTGGEPFDFCNPNNIALYYKKRYPNIKKIIIYTNAKELAEYRMMGGKVDYIDGVNISLKNKEDKKFFESYICFDKDINNLSDNRIYAFPKTQDVIYNSKIYLKIDREWQIDFEASPDSIFRRI